MIETKEIDVKKWQEIRAATAVDIEMLHPQGLIVRAKTYLKSESPRSVEPNWHFVRYDIAYVKYYFLKEFYGILLAEQAREQLTATINSDEILDSFMPLLASTIAEFKVFASTRSNETPIKIFRAFCEEVLQD